ncbi:hypothetical protein BSR29_00495 [Boudabousia liubingyangii]|uniref:Uncharacterized protein n=1 Tax=Boudabousia liubingyangii TaxID=1921764 RepID=A0A1Q5PPN1_9ACTO|nr:hypothetical protein [Boudabousia liubingyangii]OKL49476.1 hypothetical protein BSR29_00495 [Boudabousia liubingyangii]
MPRKYSLVFVINFLAAIFLLVINLLSFRDSFFYRAGTAVAYVLFALSLLSIFYVIAKNVLSQSKRIKEQQKALSNLAGTIGKAAPVLRRVDDRSRSILNNSLENITQKTPRDFLAFLVRDEHDAERGIELFEELNGWFDRLVLVLDWTESRQWGSWIEKDFGPKITIVAGEHLIDGTADPSALGT